MEFSHFLIKYGEIAVKGKNRNVFEDALGRQIRIALKRVDGSFVVEKKTGRFYVHCQGEYDYDGAVEALRSTQMSGKHFLCVFLNCVWMCINRM